MLAEPAIALAQDDRLPDRHGVLTPATALGIPFVDRFPQAGLRLVL